MGSTTSVWKKCYWHRGKSGVHQGETPVERPKPGKFVGENERPVGEVGRWSEIGPKTGDKKSFINFGNVTGTAGIVGFVGVTKSADGVNS